MVKSIRRSTRVGDEWLSISWLFGHIGFYKRITQQNWSHVLVEETREYGIQFANMRVCIKRTWLVWSDGKSPKIEAKFWP